MTDTNQSTYDQVLAKIPTTTDLYYVEYDSRLRPEQAHRLLQSGDGFSEMQNEILDLWADSWHESVETYLQEAAKDAGVTEDDLTTEEVERLREAIMNRDRSNPIKDLASGNRYLLRFRLGDPDEDLDLPQNLAARSEGYDLDEHARRLARMAGVEYEPNAQAFRQLVIEQDYYGGQLYVFWQGTITEFFDPVLNEDQPHTVTWTDPSVLLLDGFNGSGYDSRITGTITRTFRPGLLGVDGEGFGFGWDQTAGLVHSYYRNDPTVRLGVNLSKEITA